MMGMGLVPAHERRLSIYIDPYWQNECINARYNTQKCKRETPVLGIEPRAAR